MQNRNLFFSENKMEDFYQISLLIGFGTLSLLPVVGLFCKTLGKREATKTVIVTGYPSSLASLASTDSGVLCTTGNKIC